MASAGSRGKRAGYENNGCSYWVIPTRVVETRWSAAEPDPTGMRCIVSTMWR